MVALSIARQQQSRLSGRFVNPFALLFSARPWLAAAFLISSFVFGLLWIVTLAMMVSLGVGLTVGIFGLPVLFFTVVLWSWGARAKRWWIQTLLGVEIPSPYRPLPEGQLWQKFRAFITDSAVWRDLGYLVLLFPVGIIEFALTLLVIALPAAMLAMPIVFAISTQSIDIVGANGDITFIDWQIDTIREAFLVATAGLPVLLVMPYALIGMAQGHIALAKALLGPTEAALAARVDALTESRSRVMDAALAERRRIERDLHDGAQQRLVALAMQLGMAKIKMDTDPAAARTLVDQAHREAKLAMTEIRNLVQGIHPAVLTDRGLDAALSALAGRCPVPVGVVVEIDRRPPDVVESAAYFLVAEALTNIAKHSAATEAAVVVRRVRDMLTVEVSDNGLGGANPAGGSGLTGLADRVAALDGRMTVESPPGRGTRLRAELPCGW